MKPVQNNISNFWLLFCVLKSYNLGCANMNDVKSLFRWETNNQHRT